MIARDPFRGIGRVATSTWWMLLVQGVCLVLFGLLILLVPRILVFLVATLFVLAGAAVVALALRLRRHDRTVRRVVDEFRVWFHGD